MLEATVTEVRGWAVSRQEVLRGVWWEESGRLPRRYAARRMNKVWPPWHRLGTPHHTDILRWTQLLGSNFENLSLNCPI